MNDKNKTTLGKQYRGQEHPAMRTAEDVQADLDAQKPYAKPDAIPLDAYFAIKGIRDPVMRAAMESYTKVRFAPLDDWAEIFAAF